MILLALQDLLRNKHREVGVFDPHLLDFSVEPFYSGHSVRVTSVTSRHQAIGRTLYGLPNTIGPWLKDVAATDTVIVQHVCLQQDLHSLTTWVRARSPHIPK